MRRSVAHRHHDRQVVVPEGAARCLRDERAGGDQSTSQLITPNTNAGKLGQSVYLYGPNQVFNDTSLSKRIPITERVHMAIQAEFLNIFNHPTFAWNTNNGANNIQLNNFGTGVLNNSPRRIELRANIEF